MSEQLRREAQALHRAADAVWLTSEELLRQSTRMHERARQLEELSEAEEEAAAAREWIGTQVLPTRSKSADSRLQVVR